MLHHVINAHVAFVAAPAPVEGGAGGDLGLKLGIILGFVLSIGLALLSAKAFFKNPNRKLSETGVEATNVGYGVMLAALSVAVGGTALIALGGRGAGWLLG